MVSAARAGLIPVTGPGTIACTIDLSDTILLSLMDRVCSSSIPPHDRCDK